MSELTSLTLAAALEQMERGAFSADEYRRAHLDRIGALNGKLNAFLHVSEVSDHAESGVLRGAPIAIKDNIATVGTPTTCGSKMLANYASPYDATAVSRLRRAGATVLGKTNLDEFAMGSSTENSAFGVTRNPWDLSRVSGGSSGGSAAAVAAGLAPVALGSETGGSVRQPAAFCGVVGLKPTYGRISRYGLVAFASSFDQIGVFARDVRDCELLFNEIAGHDPMDSTASHEPVRRSSTTPSVSGLRVGVVRAAIESLTGEVRANFDAAVALFARGGAIVEEVSLASIRHAIAVYYIVANAEASANLARFDGVRYGHRTTEAGTLKATYLRSRGEGFGPEVKRRIMLGTFALSSGYYDAYYGRAQAIRQQMRSEFTAALGRFDLLLTPTTPEAAFKVGEKSDDPLAMYLSDIFTAPANLVGIPALAVPSGVNTAGMPLSLQLMATHFREDRLFQAAAWYETERAPMPMPQL